MKAIPPPDFRTTRKPCRPMPEIYEKKAHFKIQAGAYIFQFTAICNRPETMNCIYSFVYISSPDAKFARGNIY